MTTDNNIAIKVENIAKCFRIGAKEQLRQSFGSTLFQFIKSPVRNLRTYKALYNFDDVGSDGQIRDAAEVGDVVWALRDVSFSVERGDRVGIIGVNGAGKSTLLKILSRITPPTKGQAEIRGRISSLLEVGTGFHQELTGRENVYLNGTVLGMSKKEVDRKFDEIVEFSGVDKFLDTPVKRYSSGMKVRLAFAVAAHLEPEILIVDEVLAVGDAAFQRKCLDKMEDVGKHGRTVLFVSHNMPAITRLCNKAILLGDGTVTASGSSHDVVGAYLSNEMGTMAERQWPEGKRPGGDIVRLQAARVVSEHGAVIDSVDIRQPVGLQMEYEVIKPGHVLLPHFYIYNEEGAIVFGTVDRDPRWRKRPRPLGRYVSTAWIPGNLMAEGTFFVNCNLTTLEPDILQFLERQIIGFHVSDTMDGDSTRGDWAGQMFGVIRPMLKWTTEEAHMPQSVNGDVSQNNIVESGL